MNFLRRFMYGRYGNDHLNLFLLVLYIAATLLSSLLDLELLNGLALVFIFLAFFRMLSRNLSRRRAENTKFLQLSYPARQWFKMKRSAHKDREHRYLKCPNCGQVLRVPRGKGRINVTCRSCSSSFEAKS